MSLEKVVNEITEQANAQAKEVIDSGKKEAREIRARAQSQADKNHEKTRYNLDRNIKEIRKMELSTLNISLKKQELNAKKQSIEAVYGIVAKKLEAMPSARKHSLLKKLLEKASKEIRAKYYSCSKKDMDLIKKLVPKLQFKESIDCLGGFVLETADETVRVNYCFDVLLQELKRKTLKDLLARSFD